MSLSWYWPLSRRGNSQGKQNIGFDDFSGDYLGNLARETIQNSLDARKCDDPVIVEFSLFKTDASVFPALEDFLFNYVKDWIDRDNQREKSMKKERALMDKIMRCFVQSQTKGITWLRITDKNTKGLRGVSTPLEETFPWFAFIVGSGMDVKGEGSGGSKGLGKAAIFLNSAIQTIFVSTVTDLGEKGNIGYAKLVSKRVDDDGRGRQDYTQGVGYCVSEEEKNEEMNTPNPGLLNFDPTFSRDESETGTDIFVPFFMIEDDSDWAPKMISEAIISFMPALNDGDLEITINDTNNHDVYHVDKSTLYLRLSDSLYFRKEKTMSIAQELYKTLNYPTNKGVKNAGTDRELNILISTNQNTALNKVYTFRWKTKMRIEVFSCDTSVPYSAVILIKGNGLSEELKAVEDASHSKWKKEKYKETDYPKEVIYSAIDSIHNFAREELEKLEESGLSGTSDFDWASDEGWNSDNNADTLDGSENEDLGLPTEEITFEPTKKSTKSKKRKPKKKRATEEDQEGEAEAYVEGNGFENEEGENFGSHPSGHNRGGGNDPHPGPDDVNITEDDEGNAMMVRKRVSTISSKMPVKNINEGLFTLMFVPSKSGENVEIELLKSGFGDENESASIIEASLDGEQLNVVENKIYLPSIKKNTLYKINLKLKEHRIYVWEVNVNANE